MKEKGRGLSTGVHSQCVCLLLCVSVCVCLNLLDEAVTFSGPTGSLFGFSVDFHTISNK
uniref:Uncharacterized protein n=1 Tax=Seriola dumerili TaxID=41447 RepID=A0A3B4VQV8_SERDU